MTRVGALSSILRTRAMFHVTSSAVQYEDRRYLGLDFLIDRVDVQEEEVCQCTLVLLCMVHNTTRSDRSSPSGIRQVVNAESVLKLSLSEGFHSRGAINTTAF